MIPGVLRRLSGYRYPTDACSLWVNSGATLLESVALRRVISDPILIKHEAVLLGCRPAHTFPRSLMPSSTFRQNILVSHISCPISLRCDIAFTVDMAECARGSCTVP